MYVCEWERAVKWRWGAVPGGRDSCLLFSTRAEFKSALPHPNILHILFEELFGALAHLTRAVREIKRHKDQNKVFIVESKRELICIICLLLYCWVAVESFWLGRSYNTDSDAFQTSIIFTFILHYPSVLDSSDITWFHAVDTLTTCIFSCYLFIFYFFQKWH